MTQILMPIMMFVILLLLIINHSVITEWETCDRMFEQVSNQLDQSVDDYIKLKKEYDILATVIKEVQENEKHSC